MDRLLRDSKSKKAVEIFRKNLKHKYLGFEESRKLILDVILKTLGEKAKRWNLAPKLYVREGDNNSEKVLQIDFYLDNIYAADLSNKIVDYLAQRENNFPKRELLEFKMYIARELTSQPIISMSTTNDLKSLEETFIYISDPKFELEIARSIRDKIYFVEKKVEKLLSEYETLERIYQELKDR